MALRLIQIKDYSDLEAGIWSKTFTLTLGGEERFTVVVGDEVNCSCGGRGYGKTPTTRGYTCPHRICSSFSFPHTFCFHAMLTCVKTDVIRYLLNCPEPLRWQSSFLPSELGEIFRKSHLYDHFNTGGYPDPLCTICFKPMSFEDRKHCGIQKHSVHPHCLEIFTETRALFHASESKPGCVLCEDADELVWEKIMERTAARKLGAAANSHQEKLSSSLPPSSGGPSLSTSSGILDWSHLPLSSTSTTSSAPKPQIHPQQIAELIYRLGIEDENIPELVPGSPPNSSSTSRLQGVARPILDEEPFVPEWVWHGGKGLLRKCEGKCGKCTCSNRY